MRPETGDPLVFLCVEGRFAKQTMERSDFVCVRNGPRSKHFYKAVQVRNGDPGTGPG